jgi:putative tricarboxylic transport membrane protein
MISRRVLLLGSAAAGAGLLMKAGRLQAGSAMFDRFNIFIPAGVGGGWDGVGRAIDQIARGAGLLSEVSIENVTGAGGTVGLPQFINKHKGRDDSVMVAGNVMIGAVITNKTPYGLKDVVPVARLTQEAGVIAVGASSPYKTIQDLLDALKADPSLPIGGGSAGGIDHITLGLTLKAIGADTAKANYIAFTERAQAVSAMMGNQVRAAISGTSEYAEQIKAGNLRALATTGEAPVAGLNVPTLKDAGIDVVMASWRGLFAPPAVQGEKLDALVKFATALHDLPAWKKVLSDRQWDDAFLTGPAFETAIGNDITAMTVALKAIGLA